MPLSSFLPSRKTVSKTAGFMGGMYMAHIFLRDRLEEAKEKLESERLARENLKRRFAQTTHTTSYTILALLPELADQILSEMDVESLTKELQSRSAKSKALRATANALPTSISPPAPAPAPAQPQQSQEPKSPSIASSIEVVREDEARSLEDSVVSLASSTREGQEQKGSSSPSLMSVSIDSLASSSAMSPVPPPAPVVQSQDLSESMTSSLISSATTTTNTSEGESKEDKRSKVELWNEVKILTLTRTLTTLYSLTLLTLLTLTFTTLTQAVLNGPCDFPGLGPGTCLHVDACARGGGTSVTGRCGNDPVWVRCCFKRCPGTSGNGICRPSTSCSPPNTSTDPDSCPGPDSVRCCVPFPF